MSDNSQLDDRCLKLTSIFIADNFSFRGHSLTYIDQYGIRVTNAEDLRRGENKCLLAYRRKIAKKAKVSVRKKFWLA